MNNLYEFLNKYPKNTNTDLIDEILKTPFDLIKTPPFVDPNRPIKRKINSGGKYYLLCKVKEKVHKNYKGFLVTETLPFYDISNKEWYLIKYVRQEGHEYV